MSLLAFMLTLLASAFTFFIDSIREALASSAKVALMPKSLSEEIQQRLRATAARNCKTLGNCSYGIAVYCILCAAATVSMIIATTTLSKADLFVAWPVAVLLLLVSEGNLKVGKFAFKTAKKFDLKPATV